MDSPQALDGVRVLDFSHALAGPYCTLLLASYGATVYKVETPNGGDIARGWGPPFVGGQSSFFLGLNRGKYGLSIDLKKPEGLEPLVIDDNLRAARAELQEYINVLPPPAEGQERIPINEFISPDNETILDDDPDIFAAVVERSGQ